MTASTNSAIDKAADPINPVAICRQAAIFLIIEVVLIFAPLIILGAAINWPASLDQPADVNLPLILEQYDAMITGYSIYLIYSLLFWPMAYLTGLAIVRGDISNTILRVATGFAVLSVLARALGIVRWLFAMPVLARLYTNPATSGETKANISMVYEMLNAYAGGVGELLGVSLFAAVWMVLINMLIIRSTRWPGWLGYFGLVVAAALILNLLEMVGIDMGPMITVSETLQHFWMLATAIIFFRVKA
ncbi:hypothetical protein JY97_16595 [Alkalispirochaeta odontotermitis]|nr:hypothetical protein JY97_16595 [Alkalispirochaeta odontotermitis]CAB1074750.1 hypothetical protein D1AOALGA4SA_2569 [Olavius algarvensis Delta 1 endosymbiont]